MKVFTYNKYIILMLAIFLVLSSCKGNNVNEEEISFRVQVSLTMEALETNVASTLAAQDAAKEEEFPKPSITPSAPSPSPTMTLTPTIEHLMIPGDPQGAQSSLTDVSTAPLAGESTSIGDSYVINLFERPFTAEVMDYRGYLDITYASLIVDSTWIYVIIHLEEELPESIAATYGIEFDLDIDGRGDWLILATLPPISEWTTEGVGVYKDTDGDVGAATPLRSDAPVPSQNGYEEEVFWAGQGTDPDTAWTRRDPNEPNRVQIAFKNSLLDTSQGFLWGIWAVEGNDKPAWFDYNDHFTLEEAGSPIKDSKAYPIKALSLLDSTCRSWFGFEPTGNEPGICGMVVPEQKHKDDDNMGWCVRASTHMGCASPCYEECPQGASCMPCILP